VHGSAAFVQAQVTEEEFKRALQQNFDEPIDPNKLVAFGLVILAITLLTVVVNRWRASAGRPGSPAAINSPGKLIREMCKTANLRPAEVKQLRILSEQQQVSSPLTLLLCPSVLGKAIRENQRKIDRGILGGLAKRIARR